MIPPFLLGLDLGQTQDFTALAVLERRAGATAGVKPAYALRHLRRFRCSEYTRQCGLIIATRVLCGDSIEQ